MSSITLILNDQLRVPISSEQVDLSLDFSFDNFSPNPQLLDDINITALCTNDEFDIVNFINNWVNQIGIHQGVPAKIQDSLLGDLLINGLVNLPKSTFQKDEGIWKLRVEQFNNTFLERASGFNLRELYLSDAIADNYKFTEDDFRIVRYVLNQVPDTALVVSLAITLFIITKELNNLIKELSKAIADILGGITGGVVAGLKIAALVLYVGLVIAGIINLLKQLSDAMFQKPKALYTIPAKTLLEKACKYLGYKFESDLFVDGYEDLVILPSTVEPGKIKGKPTNNPIPNQTLLDAFNDLSTLFNAKIKVVGDTVYFRNKFDYISEPINFFLADLKNKGEQKFNLDELPQSLQLSFRKDPIETNTYLRLGLLGINLQGKSVSTDGNELTVTYSIEGLEERLSVLNQKIDVNIPYARGYRKDRQTGIEKVFNTIYDVANKIGSVIPGNKKKLGANPFKIGDRLGALLLNADFIGNSKVFLLGGDQKIRTDSFEKVHTESIYNSYYYKESPEHNQQVIFTGRDKEPICNINFIPQLLENNICYDSDGNVIMLQENKRDAYNGLHEITYRQFLKVGDFGYISKDKITTTKIGQVPSNEE